LKVDGTGSWFSELEPLVPQGLLLATSNQQSHPHSIALDDSSRRTLKLISAIIKSQAVMLWVRQTLISTRKFQPSVFDVLRRFSDKGNFDIGEDLVELMHGRKNLERRDSVNNDILLERQKHQLRIQNITVNKADVRLLSSLGIGSKKRIHSVYKVTFNQYIDVEQGSYKKSQTGSGDCLHSASDSYC
jgi:hypothetical protein